MGRDAAGSVSLAASPRRSLGERLQETAEGPLRRSVGAMLERALGMEILGFAGRGRNLTFQTRRAGRPELVKVLLGEAAAERAARLEHLGQAWRAHPFPMPEVREVLELELEGHAGDPLFVVRLEYVAGQTASELAPGLSPADRTSLATRVGQLLAAVHGALVRQEGLWRAADPPATRPEVMLRRLLTTMSRLSDVPEECADIADEVQSTLQSLFQEHGSPPESDWRRLIQGDAKLNNLICKPDGSVCFIDWEEATLYDPAWELAHLSLDGDDAGVRLGPAFLAGYLRTQDREPQEALLGRVRFWQGTLLVRRLVNNAAIPRQVQWWTAALRRWLAGTEAL